MRLTKGRVQMFCPILRGMGLFSEVLMDNGHFYFINDQYFKDFPDPYLMQNKETVNGQIHNRPCFLAFEDSSHKGLFWMIPFSSQTNKFHTIYKSKISCSWGLTPMSVKRRRSSVPLLLFHHLSKTHSIPQKMRLRGLVQGIVALYKKTRISL